MNEQLAPERRYEVLERVAVTGAGAIQDRLVHGTPVPLLGRHHEGNNTIEPSNSSVIVR